MQTKKPVHDKGEYELPCSDENEDSEATAEVKEISIEGYNIVFDKKVMAIPSEVITIDQYYV